MHLYIFFFVISLIFLWISYNYNSKSKKLNKYIPTYRIGGLPFGIPSYFGGNITVNQPLFSPISRQPCVSYKLEEQVESKNDKGEVSRSWQQVSFGQIPFWVQDKTGFVLIKPSGSQIDLPMVSTQLVQNSSSSVQVLGMNFQSVAGQNMRESYLPINWQMNIFGVMELDNNDKVIQNSKEWSLIITTKTKEQMTQGNLKAAKIFLGISAAIIILILGNLFWGYVQTGNLNF